MKLKLEHQDIAFMLGRYSTLREFGTPEQLAEFRAMMCVTYRMTPAEWDDLEERMYGRNVGLSVGQFEEERKEAADDWGEEHPYRPEA